VLITGCSSGIGRATALACVRAGLTTFATARRPESLADLEAAGCSILELDVTSEDSALRAVRAVQAKHGAVGALINNAGHGGGGPVEETPLELMRELFETNVFGLIRMCQLVLPGMRAQRSGVIVNLGSAAGLVTPPTAATYSMTKYALEAFSDALRFEVRPLGVRVVLVEPGAVRTNFMANGDAYKSRLVPVGPYETLKLSVDRMAARAHGEGARAISSPEDVAHAIVQAVTSARPKTRYKVGSQAVVAPFVRRLVGDRLWDGFMYRVAPFSE
jgi:NAD(P)-dependent dehydrogenase (short-subunit alcohol dehydrogenase family)